MDQITRVKETNGEWIPLETVAPYKLNTNDRTHLTLLDDGILIACYPPTHPVTISALVPEPTRVYDCKGKHVVSYALSFPYFLWVSSSKEACSVTFCEIKAKVEHSVKIKVNSKDILLTTQVSSGFVVVSPSHFYLFKQPDGMLEAIVIDRPEILPTKLSTHIDLTHYEDRLLLCQKREFFVWDVRTGMNITHQQLEQNIMICQIAPNGTVVGSTINWIFFWSAAHGLSVVKLKETLTALEFSGSFILAGTITGTILCYDLPTRTFLYSITREGNHSEESDQIRSLVEGGGIHSLAKRGNLVFGGMRDHINIWKFDKKNQTTPVVKINTGGKIVFNIRFCGNSLHALCGKERHILSIDLESNIAPSFDIDQPDWTDYNSWSILLPPQVFHAYAQKREAHEDSRRILYESIRKHPTSSYSHWKQPDFISEEFSGLISRDGGLCWLPSKVSLSMERNDIRLCVVETSPANGMISKPLVVPFVWSFGYETFLLTSRQHHLHHPAVFVVRFITNDGWIDVRHDDVLPSLISDTLKEWDKTLTNIWTRKFIGKEMVDSENLIKHTELAHTEIILCLDFLCQVVLTKIKAGSSIVTSKVLVQVKERSPLKKKAQLPVTELHAELFSDILVFSQYQANHEKGRKTVAFVLIRESCLHSTSLKNRSLTIHSPFFSFELKFPHQTILNEWVKYLSHLYGSSTSLSMEKDSSDSLECEFMSTSRDSFDFVYTKPIGKSLKLIQLPPSKKKKYTVNPGLTTLGRSRENTITIDDVSVSRFHAKIDIRDNIPVVTDLGSTSGTYLNGNLIRSGSIKPGDKLAIGKIEFEIFLKKS